MTKQVLKLLINLLQESEPIAEKKFQRAQYKNFEIKVQALKDFINFEATRANGTTIKRNIYNLDLFADGGRSNPSFSCIRFQKELNVALKTKAIGTIKEDGFFGSGTAKALQQLINAYLPVGEKLTINGKIVSEIDTSKKTADVLDKMILDNEPFVIYLIDFVELHGHIQQHGVFPIAKQSDGSPFIDV